MLTCHLLDEGSDRLVNEVSFEFIPIDNQATGTLFRQAYPFAVGVQQRHQADALNRAAVLAAPEIAHQLSLALLAVGLVQHGIIHAQGAAFHVQQRPLKSSRFKIGWPHRGQTRRLPLRPSVLEPVLCGSANRNAV